jgi:hypothetical protein
VATIGCGMCAGPDEFGSITGIALGAGRVVVADRDPPHLRVFGPDGTFLHTAGADGEGPGELRFPLAVAVTEEGMAAVDMRLSRVVQVDHQGQERGTLRLPSFPLAASFAPGTDELDVSLADFRAREATIHRADGAEGWRTLSERVDGLQLRSPGEPPLLFSLARAPGGGLAVGVASESYRLLFLDTAGAVVREVTRDVPRTPRTSEEIAALRDALARGPAGRRRADGGGRAVSTPEVDPLRPHFGPDALRFDPEGRLWVRTARAREGTLFDLFDAEGGYLGEVRVPGRVQAFGMGDGLLAAAVLDDYDVATVRIWRVEATPPGG